jgi:hypothetical protein
MKNRISKLSFSDIQPLFDGIDPPSGKINPDYVEQPRNMRKCTICGKMHDLILENTKTGERIEEMENCYQCSMEKWFKPKILTEQVMLHEN